MVQLSHPYMTTGRTIALARRTLVGKVISLLYSILKSRDITLPTKVHTVKAMLFPLVMYGCESWIIKKAEHQGTDTFELCWKGLLKSPLDSKIKPANPKGNKPWIFIGRTDAESEAPVLWPPDVKSQLTGKDHDPGKDWRQKQKGRWRMKWLDGITDWMDVSLSKVQGIVEDRRVWRAAVHGVVKSWTWLMAEQHQQWTD